MNDNGEPAKGVTLVALEVENFKKIRVVRIRPDGAPIVVVGGDNDQGKSTLLDSIEALIGGRDHVPEEPLRRGAASGRIFGRFSNGFTAERRFGRKGKGDLVVLDADGVPPPGGPQTALDALYDELAFEPLELLRQKPKELVETFKRALGLDFSDIDQEIVEKTEERKHVNRRARDLKGQLADAQRHKGVPDEPVSVSELSERLKQAHAHNADRERAERRVAEVGAEIERVKAEIAELERKLKAARARLDQALDQRDEADAALEQAGEAVDTTELENQIRDAELTNAKIRHNRELAANERELHELGVKSESLTEDIRELELEKANRLSEAQFPVEGLAFGPDGLTLDGLPFEQAATSRKIRVVVALGFRLKKRAKILLIRRGSELNEKNLQLLAELAEQEGGQCWVERVAPDGKGCTVVLEDGEVREPQVAE